MELQSINIGQKQTLQIGSDSVETGIFKTPVTGAVQITGDGVGDDMIANLMAHGGPDQAVYIYGGADYAWWAMQLATELEPGTFGENLTITELESGPVGIGDRLRLGTVVLEVTGPRIPCSKLSTKMGDPMFVRRFNEARRPGLYCRVIEAGTACAGDSVTLEPFAGESITNQALYDVAIASQPTESALRQALAAPIASRLRDGFEATLQAI